MLGNQRVLKMLDLFSQVFLVINAALIPLFVDKNLSNFYVIPKQYVFICLLLVNVILFVAKMIISKSLFFRRSVMDLPIIGLLAAALFSAVFSVNHYDSFLGRNEYFVFNYVYLIFLALLYFLIVNIVNSRSRWVAMIDTLIYTGGFTALLFAIKSIFKLDLIGYIIPGALNTIDKLNTPFGLWMVVIFVLAAGNMLKRNLSLAKTLAYFSVTILTFVSLLLLSFSVLWWVVIAGLILLLLIGVSFMHEVRLGWVSALFAMLILTVVFIAFGTPRAMQTSVPAEISLGVSPSWSIGTHTILSNAKNFILGSGLGTFNVDFSKFRDVAFNADSVAWSLRFSQPYSTFYALFSEGGVLMFLVFLFIVLYAIGHVFNVWFKRLSQLSHKTLDISDSTDVRVDVFVATAAWLVLTGSMAIVFYGPVLWWLWWTLLGMVIVGLSFVNPEITKLKQWEMEDTPQYSLTFSFVMIVVLAGLIMVGVWGARLYMADVKYAKALSETNYDAAQTDLNNALSLRTGADLYHTALAQVYLAQAAKLVNSTSSADLQTVSSYVALAVNEARTATELSPKSVAIWENLAVMYENAAVLVPEARSWALKSWQTAKDLEPTNPLLALRLGNNYYLSKDYDNAAKSYKEATDLKSDYLDAYVGLAGVYEQQSKMDEAVDTYKKSMNSGGSSNASILYDFGRVLYNRNKDKDRDDAEILWKEAVRLQPNYSNALFSLGMLYESRGNKSDALQYYYRVKDLNPDNKDIATKIRSLVNGGSSGSGE